MVSRFKVILYILFFTEWSNLGTGVWCFMSQALVGTGFCDDSWWFWVLSWEMASLICIYLASWNQTGARNELSSEYSQLNKGLYECVSL